MIRATVTLTQPLSERRQFVVRTGGGHHFLIDDDSGGSGPTPVELVATALAGCTALAVIASLRDGLVYVSDYEVQVEAGRSRERSAVFEEVRIHHIFSGIEVDPATVASAIRSAEEQNCALYAGLGTTAQLRTTFEVREIEVEDGAGHVIHGEVR